jgi:BirA family biotin operon repressor/biotin-[acetyl-CoA-carboxylase] ligase
VAGVGINLLTPPVELAPLATSVATLTGRVPDVDAVTDALLAATTARLLAWEADGGDPGRGLREDYRSACTTPGPEVRVVSAPGATRGTAVDVDADGALVLRTRDGDTAVSAGDVEHVR